MDTKELRKNIDRLSNGKSSKFLLTVSGGADSVAMLDIFAALGYNCIIAHCNFHLRGDESDRDECYVRELAKKYSIPYFIKSFNTTKFAKQNSLSIEMAARELRYKWFEELSIDQDCDCIVVAHHAGDVVETVFINLLRGTGIKGIGGISEKNGKIIRPFLKYSRKEILSYLDSKGILYCEDSTNLKTDYVRNKIRHNIIPVFEDINPSFLNTMLENTSRFRDVAELYQSKVSDIKSSVTSTEGNILYIDLHDLQNCVSPSTILFEILKEYNFGSKIIDDIFRSLEGLSGKQFFSPTHKIIKDRDRLIICTLEEANTVEFSIDEGVSEIAIPICINLDTYEAKDFTISKSSNVACIDNEKVEYPLVIRKWRKGDVFYPFGMKGKKKKVSDYFTDHKFSLKDKEDAWILEIGGEIAWLIGHRVDERFRITAQTTTILKLSLY